MIRDRAVPLAFALALSCACAGLGPAHRDAPAARERRRSRPLRLSSQDSQRVEQLYYRAVDAYSRNDMSTARARLDELLAIDPAHAPALELLGKIRKAAPGR